MTPETAKSYAIKPPLASKAGTIKTDRKAWVATSLFAINECIKIRDSKC